MTTLMKADVFFFITSITVIVLGLALTVLIIMLIRAVRDGRRIIHKVETEIDVFSSERKKIHVTVRSFEKVFSALVSGDLFRRMRRRHDDDLYDDIEDSI